MGLADELAAVDADSYVRTAAVIASDTGRLAALRRTLRDRVLSSPLCRGEEFGGKLEAAFRDMWRRYCAVPLAPP